MTVSARNAEGLVMTGARTASNARSAVWVRISAASAPPSWPPRPSASTMSTALSRPAHTTRSWLVGRLPARLVRDSGMGVLLDAPRGGSRWRTTADARPHGCADRVGVGPRTDVPAKVLLD